MTSSVRRRVLCFTCHAVLRPPDREHYLTLCHACAMTEHDLARALAADPGHPDRDLILDGPVDLRPRPRLKAVSGM